MENLINFISIVSAILGAYITVKISITELKKDNQHLNEKLEIEINSKNKMLHEHTQNMNEVREDVKAIFRTLTKIQVDMARTQGTNDVLESIKEVVNNLGKRT